MLGFAIYQVKSAPVKRVPRDGLSFQTVQNGSLDIYTDVYGELVSAREQLLTAPAMGNVTEVLALPGTKVTPDTPILRLSNPQLEQEVSQARGLLAEKQAEREAFKYEQKNDRLNFQGQIEDIKSEIEKAKLEQSVQQNLLNRGVASVIELKRANLSVKQQSARLNFEQRKYGQFVEMQAHKLKQMDITLEQQQATTHALETQLDSMFLRAGMSGSLQSLEVELGESVQLGQALARVGSDRELIARLRLPRNKADQIDIGAPVIIDTQKGLLKARIRRVESVVTEGFVRADAMIEGKLTSNARPSLAVSAKVFVEHRDNVTYVEQASGFRPNSRQSVFVLSENHRLQKRNITFGPLSFKKLLVTDGLDSGEELVSSEMQTFNKFEQIIIEG
jgi:multidrug resistance efflux pump